MLKQVIILYAASTQKEMKQKESRRFTKRWLLLKLIFLRLPGVVRGLRYKFYDFGIQ